MTLGRAFESNVSLVSSLLTHPPDTSPLLSALRLLHFELTEYIRWLVRAIKSTSFFTATVINWPSTLITVEGDNCRSTVTTVDRHF